MLSYILFTLDAYLCEVVGVITGRGWADGDALTGRRISVVDIG